MILRAYESSDCPSIAELFYNTIHTVNAKDYSSEQLDAWATGQVDLSVWDASFLAHRTIVAVEDGRIIGFGDMDDTGYLDRNLERLLELARTCETLTDGKEQA